MVLASPGPLLTPPPSSSPTKTPFLSYSATTPPRYGNPTPPSPGGLGSSRRGRGMGVVSHPAERAHASITPYVDSPNLPTAIAQHKMSSTCAYAKINTRELENTGQLSAADHSSTFRLCATSSWRIHCGVEVTELSTNKQHTLSHAQRAKHCSLDCENIHKFVHSM